MRRNEFFKKISRFVSSSDLKPISWANWLAKKVHRAQKRDCGERYFEHCRGVASILLDFNVYDVDAIIIALLHDCVEDGFIPIDFLEKLFGNFVARSINILSKVTPVSDESIGKIIEKKKKNNDEYYSDIFSSEWIVKMVKLADRLHNLRDMRAWPPERKRKYVIETEKYILPIAIVTDSLIHRALKKECDEEKDRK